MNFRQILQDYFTFSRNERKGITILLVLIFMLAVTNKVIFYFETPAKIDSALLDSCSRNLGLLNDSMDQKKSPGKLFSFNPNTIDSETLGSLDLPEPVKLNLLKFRSNGGQLYSGRDFKKIYGVTDELYNQVAPYLLFGNAKKSTIINTVKPELFLFDPNKATDEEFLRLGLSGKQVAAIRNYQDKGGSFRSKEGFFRIWGLHEEQKRILADFIFIGNTQTKQFEKKSPVPVLLIDLNSADSTDLKQLPGIGEKLSKRIVKYRDLLGGFYSVNQLREVYGLSEPTIQQIEDKVTMDVSKIRKIDVNFADVNELARHPYLQKKLASQIIKYRTKNGSIRDLTVLRDSMILNIDEYDRLKAYF
ncbi:MAG: helix-hairpin-helix domain-containing protein [Bacteroidota bacterium]|nr:helix-hairpin-helix domain-containing protein [Bacteroidota bacterium]